MIEEIKNKLGEGYEAEEIVIHKNNGIVKHGIRIRRAGDSVAPVIYTDGIPECKQVNYIVKSYEAHKVSPFPNAEKLINKDYILKNVYPVLINRKKNEKVLSELAHMPFLDLEIIYKVRLTCLNNDSAGSFKVSMEMLDRASITLYDLHESAKKNLKTEIINLCDIFSMYIPTCDVKMLALSNREKVDGANALLNVKVLNEVYSILGGEFIILPSSIHEVIAVPYIEKAPELVNLVKMVNATEVQPTDVLSNSVYMYDGEKVKILESEETT